MVTYQVVSKLQCEDLCMRALQCQGFNYGEQKCDILSKIYDPHEREKSVSIRAVMKKVITRFRINPSVFYHKCRNLIDYATCCLFNKQIL